MELKLASSTVLTQVSVDVGIVDVLAFCPL